MGRASRNSSLETRTARKKLVIRQTPHWQTIGAGLALGYRRGKDVSAWVVRFDTGERHASGQKKYLVQNIPGRPDDFEDADGDQILNYFQAQEAARRFGSGERERPNLDANPESYTVAEAMADYLVWHELHGKGADRTRHIINAHILPTLGEKKTADISPALLSRWQHNLVKNPIRRRGKLVPVDTKNPEVLRRRKASANRIMTVLKAALNYAWTQGRIKNRDAWERVKPFRGVDMPKERFLSEDECRRLIHACEPDFRRLVQAALLTGCRYGELTRMEARDYVEASGVVLVRIAKINKARYVPLTDEGRKAFAGWAAGKLSHELLFTRADGKPWGDAHQSRRIKEACAAARIEPAISFHDLRNTYGSMLAMRGVPLHVLSEALGHADTRMTQRHYAHLLPGYVADTIRAHLPRFGVDSEQAIVPLKRKTI